MLGIHARGQCFRVGVERQSPLPQERDAERDEQNAAEPAGQQGPVPPPDHHLGHAGHVGDGARCQEPERHRFVQGGSGQYEQGQGGQGRSDGGSAALTHVAHGTNHP